MRNAFTAVVAATCMLLSSPASALEKRSVRVGDSLADAWTASTTCRINYYNVCTGWLWCWSGFGDDFRFGVVADRCCEGGATGVLMRTTLFICTDAPCSYYGFTGTISVHEVNENDCPIEPPVAIQPYCPDRNNYLFSVVSWPSVPVPNRFAVVVTTAEDAGITSPAEYGTDRPAPGPTGPQACGVCYPANRTTRSYQWGTSSSPLCPGEKFNDGICDAELFWDFDFSCTVSVQETTWGSIKALYR
jgi:hypothetical protein